MAKGASAILIWFSTLTPLRLLCLVLPERYLLPLLMKHKSNETDCVWCTISIVSNTHSTPHLDQFSLPHHLLHHLLLQISYPRIFSPPLQPNRFFTFPLHQFQLLQLCLAYLLFDHANLADYLVMFVSPILIVCHTKTTFLHLFCWTALTLLLCDANFASYLSTPDDPVNIAFRIHKGYETKSKMSLFFWIVMFPSLFLHFYPHNCRVWIHWVYLSLHPLLHPQPLHLCYPYRSQTLLLPILHPLLLHLHNTHRSQILNLLYHHHQHCLLHQRYASLVQVQLLSEWRTIHATTA